MLNDSQTDALTDRLFAWRDNAIANRNNSSERTLFYYQGCIDTIEETLKLLGDL